MLKIFAFFAKISLVTDYSDLADEKTRAREFTGLATALKYWKQKEGLLLTDDVEREEQIENFRIRLQPVWKFLLAE